MHENEITNPDILQSIVAEVFDEHRHRSAESLESALKVQRLFTNSYKSRYFLELLQNARDAIIAARVSNGKTKAWLENECLYIANNGLPFDRKGVRSLCFPAISGKGSRDFIGHKGIGFSAVLEITDSPEVITLYGTFFFNTMAAAALLDNGHTPDELPLFQYPMFRKETISDLYPVLSKEGYTTIFCLPLKNELKGQKNLTGYYEPSSEDLIFLEAIKLLEIGTGKIMVNELVNPVEVFTNGVARYYRSYSSTIEINTDATRFTQEEKESFRENQSADCRLLLETDKLGNYKPNQSARLHLYYGMEFSTGFTFNIHSLFSVTLDRKRLATDSFLNEILFNGIAAFYGSTFLYQIKNDFPKQELEILAFKRESNNQLDKLYNALRTELRNKAFIYHEASASYKTPAEVYLVSTVEYEIFRDGFLGEMCLLVPSSPRIKTWLKEECGVGELPDSFIAKHIEAKCIQYRSDPAFFKNLYELLNNRRINVTNSRILLTQNGTLVKSTDTEIFYQQSSNLKSPAVLDESVSFLHKDIIIDRIRDGARQYLGVREYNAQSLINISIKVLKSQKTTDQKGQEIIVELLHFLKQFEHINDIDYKRITESILFPVINKQTNVKTWKAPLLTPIYFDNFCYANFYNNDFYAIDWQMLKIDSDFDTWETFLTRLGVWKIPGIYITEGASFTDAMGKQVSVINDRALHQPCYISASFSDVWKRNWTTYRQFITSSDFVPQLSVNGKSLDDEKVRNSSAFRTLERVTWLPAKQSGSDQELYPPAKVIFLTAEEQIKTANQVINVYYPVGELNLTDDAQLIADFNLKHLNLKSAANFYRLLDFVADTTQLAEIADLRNYEKCYHRFLAYLTEFYNAHRSLISVSELKKRRYLSRQLLDQTYAWTPGTECILIDEKALLDKLTANNLLKVINIPYAFTKRDKNEWGKPAKEIGRTLSSIFSLSLEITGTAYGLARTIKPVEFILAFVEADLDNNFSDTEIQHFKTADLFVHEQLLVSYHHKAKAETIKLQQPFYTTGEKEKSKLNIESKVLSHPRLLSEALLDYFEHYTGRELRRLNLIFEQLLIPDMRQDTMRKYVADHDIDMSRVEQIESLLTDDYYIENELEISPVNHSQPPILITYPAFHPVSKVVNKEVEQIELETNLTIEESLQYLDQYVSLPSEEYSLTPSTMPSANSDLILPGKAQDHTNISPRIELTESARRNVGFMAEYYVFKKLTENEQSLLLLLGLDPRQAGAVKWLNFPRLSDDSLEDQSIGHGHDFYLENHDLAIEVKGMISNTSYINITNPEFESMKKRGNNYYLIIIKQLFKGDQIKTLVIRNPYKEILNGNLHFLEAKINGIH